MTTRPSEPARVAGIVLAAGRSTRMGQQKMLLEIDGEPLVRRTCRRALAAGLTPLVVVLGHEAERVSAALEGLGCQTVFNPDFAAPLARSVQTGVRSVPAEVDAAVVLLADMYEVDEGMLRELVTRAQRSSAPLVVSRYGSVVAPPMLFRRGLFDELMGTAGDNPGKAVAAAHADELEVVDWPAGALRDLDTPEDLRNARAR